MSPEKIALDLARRGANLVAVIVEDAERNLQLIQYTTGTDGEPVVKFITDAATNFSISEHKSGNVHSPVCQIGPRNA
jgi:uncharacterized protein YeaC (DUF1315 family)